jgi:hypothetical protein
MRYCLTLLVFLLFSFFSCTDKKEEFPTESLSDYLPLQPGKYITYRIDSLVLTDFGRGLETHSYQVKHVIDSEITDNLGRPSYRIYRYLRNADGIGEWSNNGTYFITPLADRVEVIEDNLRFIKLHAPLREGYSWKGNSYLSLDPYEFYRFTLFGYMKNWEYNYDSFSSSFTHDGHEYIDVWTVEEEDYGENFPVTEPPRPGGKIRAIEKYAKNTGLVYREYMIVEYEPNTTGPNPYYRGFGITMWMIDHN